MILLSAGVVPVVLVTYDMPASVDLEFWLLEKAHIYLN